MSLIKIADFDKRYLTRPIAKIGITPKRIIPTNLSLPLNAVIHFINESEQSIGIDNSYCLLRNLHNPVYVHHVMDLVKKLGMVTPTHVNMTVAIRRYHKTHMLFKPMSNLDRSLSNNPAVIIMNYSLLSKLNKYAANTNLVYQEWFNQRSTLWDMVNQIGNRREHFIRFQIPDTLPTKSDLIRYAADFKPSGLSVFHDTRCLDLLELWRMLTPNVDSQDSHVTEDALEHVKIVFSESGILIVLQLKELIDWAQEDHTAACTAFYHFLDGLLSLRSPIDLPATETEVNNEPVSPIHNDKISQLIIEQGEMGALSAAEQKGLLKLSQKYKSIEDPHGSGLTLDQMVVTAKDLEIDRTPLMADSITIHDKGLLKSSLHSMDKDYIEKVHHKDIVQSVMMLHPAGFIVKDFKVKNRKTAVTDVNTYHVSVQPINGAASTFSFTLPVINPDGSFLSGGIRYKLDKQKGELPIIKTKPNMVALTSYYGKIFVTRSESSVNNFNKWILKELVSRANDPQDITVSGLVYGISRIGEVKLPRVYTAVSETINNFISGNYHFLFSYNKQKEDFTADQLALCQEHKLTACGKVIGSQDILGMNEDNIVYRINPQGMEGLGSLPFLIDPEMGEGPIEFTEISLINRRIPIILAFTYIYGLDKALEKLKIKYHLSPTNVRLPVKYDEYKLVFKDIIYVIDISNKYHRLLVGGFAAIKNDSKKYRGNDFNRQSSYGTLLSGLKLTNYHLRELKLMWDMFIEPITHGLLVEMGEPTVLWDLLLKASELLIDDHVPEVRSARYKGYERLAGMMYSELVSAVRNQRSQGALSNVGVTMNPNAVWLSILQDQSMALVEESNPIHNLKEQESFTHAGHGGRSAVTMTKETRGFTKHDLGIMSEATPDSAKVGIRASLSADPIFTNLRGVTREFDHEKDAAAQTLSVAGLIGVGLTHDDAKRV